MANLISGGCVLICLVGGGYAVWILQDNLHRTVIAWPRNNRARWRKRLDWLSQIAAAVVFLVVAGFTVMAAGKHHIEAAQSDNSPEAAAERSVVLAGLRPLPPRRLFYDMHRRERPLIGADLASLPITDHEIRALLRQNPDLEWLNLNGTNVTDEVLDDLAVASNLSELCVSNTAITDTGLSHLSRATRLTKLLLAGTAITDDGLIHLRALPNLRKLHIQNTPITDTGLAPLHGLSQLESLLVEGTFVTPQGFERIQRLTKIRSAD